MKPLTANLTASRYDFAFDTLQALLPSLPSKIVFDIGVGDARMRRIESLGLVYRGFDQNPWRDITHWDLTDPCPNSELTAGAVILLDVIEHCVNPGLALKNIAAVLQPGGSLILTMPNPRWSASRIHTLIFGCPSGFTQLDLDTNHHVFTPWPHILEKILHDAGFVIDDYVTLDGRTKLFKHPVSFSYPARCLLDLARKTIELLDHTACGMSYGLIARKATGSHPFLEPHLHSG